MKTATLSISVSTVCAAAVLVLGACAGPSPHVPTAGGAHAEAAPAHWTYDGEGGPEHWGDLSPNFQMCRLGRNQSPINLDRVTKADLPAVSLSYSASATEVLNNGHTIQVNVPPGSHLDVAGHRYELKQFHFHEPSENQIQGRSFAMEAHLVHADAQGNLAVVAVMIEPGAVNPMMKQVWQVMPSQAQTQASVPTPVSPEGLLPQQRDYYEFSGSLTTPPCTEGVRWLVMKQPITATPEQIARFDEVMHHHANNRPVQPLYSRTVLD